MNPLSSLRRFGCSASVCSAYILPTVDLLFGLCINPDSDFTEGSSSAFTFPFFTLLLQVRRRTGFFAEGYRASWGVVLMLRPFPTSPSIYPVERLSLTLRFLEFLPAEDVWPFTSGPFTRTWQFYILVRENLSPRHFIVSNAKFVFAGNAPDNACAYFCAQSVKVQKLWRCSLWVSSIFVRTIHG